MRVGRGHRDRVPRVPGLVNNMRVIGGEEDGSDVVTVGYAFGRLEVAQGWDASLARHVST